MTEEKKETVQGNSPGGPIVLAFSGGLDTSFCVPWLRENTGAEVVTATVDTAGIDPAELDAIERRARELGVTRHITVEARKEFFRDVLRYLIYGNVMRGGVYPLCVGSERVIQARSVVEVARKLGAKAVAHGSTAAGNDQVRFDASFSTLAPEIEVIAPVRDHGFSRDYEATYLRERGFSVEERTATYSVNRGLWGTTIGGRETHSAAEPLPESAYVTTAGPSEWPCEAEVVHIGFERGVPVELDRNRISPVELIEAVATRAGAHGVGRGMHLGDTILGVKGRVAFEAPGPAVVLAAHREIEKLVLTQWQRFWKDQLASFYGMLLHGAQFLDPVMRDLEAFLESTQARVTGRADVRLHHGTAFVLGVESPFDMMRAGGAVYGERAAGWKPEDVRGFTRILANAGRIAHLAAAAGTSDEE
jgi:argininosuccinate synthase